MTNDQHGFNRFLDSIRSLWETIDHYIILKIIFILFTVYLSFKMISFFFSMIKCGTKIGSFLKKNDTKNDTRKDNNNIQMNFHPGRLLCSESDCEKGKMHHGRNIYKKPDSQA